MVEKKKMFKALSKVIDPETGIDVVTMKMVKSIAVKNGVARIKFTPTSPFCPMMDYLTEHMTQALKALKGIKEVKIEVKY